jgi:hypothetical protein
MDTGSIPETIGKSKYKELMRNLPWKELRVFSIQLHNVERFTMKYELAYFIIVFVAMAAMTAAFSYSWIFFHNKAVKLGGKIIKFNGACVDNSCELFQEYEYINDEFRKKGRLSINEPLNEIAKAIETRMESIKK